MTLQVSDYLLIAVLILFGAALIVYMKKSWFDKKSVQDLISETKLIKIEGIIFKIKKLDPFSYMDGSKSLAQHYQIYEQKREKTGEVAFKKIKEHYRDVFMNAVIEPKLVRKETEAESGVLFVDNLLLHWDLCNSLYEQINVYTYGKKNLKLNT